MAMSLVAQTAPQGDRRCREENGVSGLPRKIDPRSLEPMAYIVELWDPEPILASRQHHVVAFLLRGKARVRWDQGIWSQEGECTAGHITVVPASPANRFQVQVMGWTRTLHWALPPQLLRDVCEQELGCSPSSIDLKPTLAVHDEELWRFGTRLADELASPGLASRLYRETLTTGLVIALLRRYSTLSLGGPSRRRLPCHKLRVALEYIQENLADGVSLRDLARAAGTSPYHFAKGFKEATGLAPHRFVLEQRVERARRLLEGGKLSLVEVALAVGFSSQSHLTTVFRRLVGVTPGAYRNQTGS
jgi:AraC family transcriptional regulator